MGLHAMIARVAPRALGAGMVVLVCALASAFPRSFELSRAGLASGQLWRLWTGHLVHASVTHFAYDVGAFVLLALFVRRPRHYLWTACWAAPVIGLGTLLTSPQFSTYCGLSGLLHGAVLLVALDLAAYARGLERWALIAIASGTFVKALLEVVVGTSLLTAEVEMGMPTAYWSHLLGALAGLLAWLPSVARSLRELIPRGEQAEYRPECGGAERSAPTQKGQNPYSRAPRAAQRSASIVAHGKAANIQHRRPAARSGSELRESRSGHDGERASEPGDHARPDNLGALR
jgi:rhomboid family GlyGly-CTERM serine protease